MSRGYAILMIQFDWSRVKKLSEGNSTEIIKIMSAITWPTGMPTRQQKRLNPYYWKDFDGLSFLLEPEKLLTKKYELPVKEIVEYIALASRRSLAEYLLTKETTLDIRLAPFIPEKNQLLTITNTAVHFMYEQGQNNGTII